jgi:alpha-L-fucosidase
MAEVRKYEPTWESLREYPLPTWIRDDKFGIYTHWGPYSVPAVGKNGTWYAHFAYMKEESAQRKHHEQTYGPLTEFGYKDFIPMFTAENFDAEEWAELFKKAGAKFAGPVAEHHDGFAMWDTRYSEWNSSRMGPKRDVVGELSAAIKEQGMRFVTAFHHAEQWMYFPVWDTRYDCGDPRYSGLYGPIHQQGEKPTKEFLDCWYGKIVEVVDKYDPDLIWFDNGLAMIREDYRKMMVAYYYNQAVERGKDVVITYKRHNLPPGVGLLDLELGQEQEMTFHEWITDSSIDDQGAWSYVSGAGFKSVDRLVDNLVDRVSKNGYLLLNVGPKPDGTIPEQARDRLLGLGKWLEVNGEAIYGTRAWVASGEGPAHVDQSKSVGFNESDVTYSAKDIRFTTKGSNLYATCLGWPEEPVILRTFAKRAYFDYLGRCDILLYESEIESISMLGDDQPLDWSMTDEGLVIQPPVEKPCEHAFCFKIVRRKERGH